MASRKNMILYWMILSAFALPASALGAVAAIDPFTVRQKYKFEYRVRVPAITGDSLRIWVPYPAENEYQKLHSSKVQSGLDDLDDTEKWTLKTESKYGNRMLYFDLGKEHVNRKRPLDIVMTYIVESRPARGYDLARTRLRADLQPRLYTTHNQWVQSNSVIRRMAKEATVSAHSESEKIRALYDYVVKIMKYNKDGVGWGKGDPIWACTAKRGNCTDFHSLYIAMARELGLAARFEIGVPMPMEVNSGTVPGYHCWAQAYDPNKGWIPFDASEAKKSGKKEAYFGQVPSDRILFSVGRDLMLNPPQKGGAINYFISPYAEMNDKPFGGLETRFHFKRL